MKTNVAGKCLVASGQGGGCQVDDKVTERWIHEVTNSPVEEDTVTGCLGPSVFIRLAYDELEVVIVDTASDRPIPFEHQSS